VSRDHILDSAESIFAWKGLEATSLRDVARGAGLDEQGVREYFADVESLYVAVLDRAVGPVLREIADTIGRGKEPAQAVAGILRTTMRALSERPQVPAIIQREALTGGGRLTPLLVDIIAPAVAAGGFMASVDLDEGGWEDDDIPHIVLTMCQAVLGYFTTGSLVQELSGRQLLSESGRERHTRFLIELTARLFPIPGRAR